MKTSAAAFAGGLLPGYLQAKDVEGDKPNIVFFLVDDMGWQDTSVPFHTEPTPFNSFYRTPNMERLAKTGIKFTNAYACPLCSPTRTSIMTGQNAARHHVTQWTLRPDHDESQENDLFDSPPWRIEGLQPGNETLASVLKEQGYRTIHVGKAHWGTIGTPGSEPKNLGFDVNIAGHAAGGPGHYYGTENFGNKKGEHTLPWGVPGLEKYHGQDVNLTDVLTIEANKAVKQAVNDGKPFYLYMSHYAVHAVIREHKPYQEHYQDKDVDPIEMAYASMIEGMDASLGSILKQLEELGVAENTIIVFASDNGGLAHGPRGKNILGTGHYTHNWPLFSGKCSAYEGGSRVPMIVSWVKPSPNRPSQRRIPIQGSSVCDKPVMCEDVLPTFCTWAGVKDTPAHFDVFDGEDITGYVTGKKGFKRSSPIILHYPHFINYKKETLQYGYGPFSAMRRDNWKVIYFYDRKKWELYDLDQDISEKNDLSKQNPKLLKRLASELVNRLKDMGAQYPVLKATGKEIPPQMPE